MQRQPELQQDSARTDRRTVPTTLSAPRSKLVWFAIATGSNTPGGLRDQLDIPLLSIYPILNSLRRHGLVRWDDETVSLTDCKRGGAD
jgi:predicted transcriptional regulator